MEKSMLNSLNSIKEKYEHLSNQLLDPEIVSNIKEYTKINKELASIEDIVLAFKNYLKQVSIIEDSKKLLQEKDVEIHNLAKEEITLATKKIEEIEKELVNGNFLDINLAFLLKQVSEINSDLSNPDKKALDIKNKLDSAKSNLLHYRELEEKWTSLKSKFKQNEAKFDQIYNDNDPSLNEVVEIKDFKQKYSEFTKDFKEYKKENLEQEYSNLVSAYNKTSEKYRQIKADNKEKSSNN